MELRTVRSEKEIIEVLSTMKIGDKISMKSKFINWSIGRKDVNGCSNSNVDKTALDRTFTLDVPGKPIEYYGTLQIAKEIMRHRKAFNDYMRQEIAIQEEEGR